ncbi:flavin reductase family protein [Vreelandella lionensis]|jgi:flavin reductase (DIM6/NTAB) family NADH-FMN oxidoreductase RutF|uniref:Flavin reductase family protein n=1 Tax=Vreelandella lionensis TaxID=1144478 RepID=A0ABW8BUE3_9GAMM|nr:flavin reductase family protein [Halomonas sp. 707B3]MAP34606.1 FMN-binding protein [Halomonas sp.]MCP1318900.1 flavin reductase family protein [Halomonas sp. 707B3]|tara:strand:- start:360 stop:971 length:612 start_codon:yes stop_codon:yes gene_type:complete
MDVLLEKAPLSAGVLYRLLSGSVCPRPIAWVATQDKRGNANLAPFSFFNVASIDPPVLAFSPLLDGSAQPKDTLRNLNEVEECVVHVGTEGLIEALNTTSASLPRGEDEFVLAGLEKAAMPGVSVPRIAAAPVAFGCKLVDVIRFGDRPLAGSLVLVQVVAIHADDSVWDGRHVNMEILQPIGRLAGSDYVRITDRFSIERPA